MKLDFNKFKDAVEKQFDLMSQGKLYCADVPDRDVMWSRYLDSFPAGTNPVYRERTEHDCSCCRQFVRSVGNVVAIAPDGSLTSIWDCSVDDPTYAEVARSMSAFVKSHEVVDRFLTDQRRIGTDRNFELADGAEPQLWTHFHVSIPKRNAAGADHWCAADLIATEQGKIRSRHAVLLRSLREITSAAIDTVLELIEENTLYKGREFKEGVDEFAALHAEFNQLPVEASETLFAWSRLHDAPPIRNTAIGTLLVDLSDGIDIETAVRSFEVKVAPENYKRPASVVTQRRVDAARKEVSELGLTSALERRYARLSDVSINNVIWADRDARGEMKVDAFSGVATKKTLLPEYTRVMNVGIEDFITNILPGASTVELMLENEHQPNLVSLVAPAHADAKGLFKWNNPFSWAYAGDAADSIRDRVKRAGGNVTGDLCCRLAWHNYDDLDLHMVEEMNRYEIFFGNRGRTSPSGGELDVDMNVGRGQTREPVENIYYANRLTMQEGTYQLYVHQYSKRESTGIGFEVEVDCLGDVHQYSCDKPLRTGQKVQVARIRYSRKRGFDIEHLLPHSKLSRTAWGLSTQDYHRVASVMYSPNHWDGERTGNRHYFFMLAGCARPDDDPPRGFFNEFLKPELDRHRKVMEIVGSRQRLAADANQLSGVGFSDTKRAEFVVRVDGRPLRVTV